MFLRKILSRPLPNTHFVTARMPVRVGPDVVEAAFVMPVERELNDATLGTVADFEIIRDIHGEPEELVLNLLLITDAARALGRIEAMLQSLDAPVGSTMRVDGTNEVRKFGMSQGLGLYLPTAETDADLRLDIVEIFTDAMEGAGLYQGSAQFGNLTALYFYGDSFNAMRKAITYALTHDPRCRNAETRRLT